MQDKDESNIETIEQENERMVMWAFGLDYHKLFPQEHQDEK